MILLLHAGLATISARTKKPWSDEGWFASPAVNLLDRGFMGTTLFDDVGGHLAGLHQRTYWIMPLHVLCQAVWYKMFGFSIFSMRALSTFWAEVALLSWFCIGLKLLGNRWTALFAAAVISVDYVFVTLSSFGRMDMMAASLGFAGLAAYLWLREGHIGWAMFAGHSFIAASIFTHPNGILHLAGLLFLMLYLDRSRISLRLVALAAAPYLFGSALWGVYILQSPHEFVAQLTWNAQGRMMSPLRAIWLEWSERYVQAFGLGQHAAGHTGPIALKAFSLCAYIAAVAAALSVPAIRRQRGPRVLLLLLAIYFTILTFFNQKLTWYLVHIIPLYCVLLAVTCCYLWERGSPVTRALVACTVLGLFAIQVGGVLYRARLNEFDTQFLPAARFVTARLSRESHVVASAGLAFGIGFDDRLLDDPTLGYYRKVRPDMIVVDEIYRADFDGYRQHSPAIFQYIRQTLQDYRLIYDHGFYQVYTRRIGDR